MDQSNTSPNPQTPLDLLTRQLGEWKELKQALSDQGESTQQVAYCIAVIENIESDIELITLQLI